MKVGIIIPCYNQGRYIRECIESVLASTFDDFEIIVVDDGSTDLKTREILSNLEYPKTRVIRQKNCGLAGARNSGIRVSVAEYILPLDADDKIAPQFLERTVQVLDSDSTVGIVGGKVELFGCETGLADFTSYSYPQILIENSLVCTQLFRRSAWQSYGGYSEQMIYGLEDWDFWLSIIEHGWRVVQLNEVLFYYRKHGASMISQLGEKEDRVRKMHFQLYENHRWLYDAHRSARNYLLFGEHSWKYRCVRSIIKFMLHFVQSECSRRRLKDVYQKIP